VWKLDLGNRPKWTCLEPLSDECQKQLSGEGGGSADSESDSDEDGDGSDSD
jgi:hypothetical protein